MTLSAVSRKSGPYAADGANKVFAYGFRILSSADLDVYVDDTLQSSALYSVSGVGADGGGNVTFTTAPADGTTVWIFGDIAVEQQNTITEGGQILSASLEESLDRLVMMIWDLKEDLERRPALKQAIATVLRNLNFADPVALNLIGWDALATGLTNYASTILQVTPDTTSGIAYGKTTATFTPSGGESSLTGDTQIPAGCELIGLTYRCTTGFGVTNGLTTVSLGITGQIDRFGSGLGITAATISNVAQFLIDGRIRPTSALDMLLSADSGTFDATGGALATAHWFTLTPDTA